VIDALCHPRARESAARRPDAEEVLLMSTALSRRQDSDGLDTYMREVRRIPLLTREEEQRLARRLVEEDDLDAAHRLVTANLRFVVKIAYEYKAYGLKMLDLVQEGNVGLMHAVKKFDPDRGYRLITYAVWWVRAYIQSYLLRAWSMVKIGTTQAQRRIFFKLASTRAQLDAAGQLPEDHAERAEILAESLGVKASEISMMEMRLAARDFSLDKALDDSSENTHMDLLVDESDGSEALVERQEIQEELSRSVSEGLTTLNAREREVIVLRHLSSEPLTLREIGAMWGVSRERARQIEAAAKEKLRAFLTERSAVVRELMPEVLPAEAA